MPILRVLKSFISSFPVATFLYMLLVILTELNFDWGWLIFAAIIDILDDVLGKVL